MFVCGYNHLRAFIDYCCCLITFIYLLIVLASVFTTINLHSQYYHYIPCVISSKRAPPKHPLPVSSGRDLCCVFYLISIWSRPIILHHIIKYILIFKKLLVKFVLNAYYFCIIDKSDNVINKVDFVIISLKFRIIVAFQINCLKFAWFAYGNS